MKVAIIPARGGSKRIPRKNVRHFAGKPMLAHSIITAQESGLFDRIIVSTDDEEIAQVANKWGAETPFERPAALSVDSAPTAPVVAHALQYLKEAGCRADYACCIYATAPLMRAVDLQKGFQILVQTKACYAFSVASYSFPVQRALRLTSNGGVDAIYPEYRDTRSQELEPAWHDAGQFYWGTSSAFLERQVIFAPHSQAVILPRYRVQDIDTEEDWAQTEIMYRLLQELVVDS